MIKTFKWPALFTDDGFGIMEGKNLIVSEKLLPSISGHLVIM